MFVDSLIYLLVAPPTLSHRYSYCQIFNTKHQKRRWSTHKKAKYYLFNIFKFPVTEWPLSYVFGSVHNHVLLGIIFLDFFFKVNHVFFIVWVFHCRGMGNLLTPYFISKRILFVNMWICSHFYLQTQNKSVFQTKSNFWSNMKITKTTKNQKNIIYINYEAAKTPLKTS